MASLDYKAAPIPVACGMQDVTSGREFGAVILAGGLSPCPLREQVGRPVLCLPLSDGQTLLSEWISVLARTQGCRAIRVVVSDAFDLAELKACLRAMPQVTRGIANVDIVADPVPWRGTAGIVRDIADEFSDGSLVLVAEGACVPPRSVECVIGGLDKHRTALVGIATNSEPAGLYGFTREALRLIPQIGFVDLKEQLLPAIHEHCNGTRAISVEDTVLRIRDRAGYLASLVTVSERDAKPGDSFWSAPSSRVARSASITGRSIVCERAVIGARVTLHASVILEDAHVEADAIVIRSVVGAGALVAAGMLLSDTVIPCQGNVQPDARSCGGRREGPKRRRMGGC